MAFGSAGSPARERTTRTCTCTHPRKTALVHYPWCPAGKKEQ